MIVKHNGSIYKDDQIEIFSTGAIFIKPLKKAFWKNELEFVSKNGKAISAFKSSPLFMVYVDGGWKPKFKHDDMTSAENEAKRLALITGRKAYVLCSLKSYEVREVIETDCRPMLNDNDELPF